MTTETCQCPGCSSGRAAKQAMAEYKAKPAAQREMIGSAGRLQQIIDAAYADPQFLQTVNATAMR